jgi:hypothetical protein
MPLSLPTTVPRSFSGSCSGCTDIGGGGAAGNATGGGSAAAGRRREGKKIGRSWVAINELNGISHSGLPPAGGEFAPVLISLFSGGGAAARCASAATPQPAQVTPSHTSKKCCMSSYDTNSMGGAPAPEKFSRRISPAHARSGPPKTRKYPAGRSARTHPSSGATAAPPRCRCRRRGSPSRDAAVRRRSPPSA